MGRFSGHVVWFVDFYDGVPMNTEVCVRLAKALKDDDLFEIVKDLIVDAERYRWLCKYTSQLFMVTEEQMNDQVDRSMGKK